MFSLTVVRSSKRRRITVLCGQKHRENWPSLIRKPPIGEWNTLQLNAPHSMFCVVRNDFFSKFYTTYFGFIAAWKRNRSNGNISSRPRNDCDEKYYLEWTVREQNLRHLEIEPRSNNQRTRNQRVIFAILSIGGCRKRHSENLPFRLAIDFWTQIRLFNFTRNLAWKWRILVGKRRIFGTPHVPKPLPLSRREDSNNQYWYNNEKTVPLSLLSTG